MDQAVAVGAGEPARPGVTVPALRGERTAGALLLRSGPGAAMAVTGVALAAALLAPAGLWRPVIVWPVVVVVLALAWRLAAALPVLPGPAGRGGPVPVWAAAVVGLAAAGHGGWALLTRAEQVVLRRDSGSYALYAQWLATRHGLPVEARLGAFGGPGVLDVAGFTLASPAYYQVVEGPAGAATGAHVVPQFLVGAPALWSLGWWVDGWAGLLAVPALVSALAVVAVAGLAARLVGPRWASLAAVTLVLTFPVLHVARSTYSEAPALLLVAAAASLAVDATVAGRTADGAGLARRLALGAGVVLGLAGLVRVDALREVALVLPGCALLAVRGHPAARPLAVGAVGAVGVSALAGLGLSRPYLASIAGSLVPLLAAFVVLGGGSLVAVAVGRRRQGGPGPPAHLARVLPRVASAAVLLIGVLLAGRPLWLVVRQSPDDPGSRYVRGLQFAQGLRLDGGRTYAEHSLTWVSWWTGPVAVVAAWLALAGLAGAGLRWWLASRSVAASPASAAGATPGWLLPGLVGLGSLMLTLYRPGITPDHPWADRRLVPVVLPVVVLAATAAAAAAFRWSRRRMPATLLAGVAVTGVAALVVPPAIATWPLRAVRTERGETVAVQAVCTALRRGDVVLAVDARGANEWPQVVRGICGRPAAALRLPRTATPADRVVAMSAVRARVAAALVDGVPGRLVLLAAGGDVPGSATLAALGVPASAVPDPVTDLDTVEDARLLVRRPDGVIALPVEVWLAPAPG